MADNLILIGMPGVGKSTIGVVLSKTLGYDFLDTDLVIQKRENRLLQQIIDEDGFDRFIQVETQAVLSIHSTHTVIATGGSVVYSPDAMTHLHSLGTVIYLQADYPLIVSRLNNIHTRGVAIRSGHTLFDMYHERLSLYQKHADLTISCQDKSVEQVINQILSAIGPHSISE